MPPNTAPLDGVLCFSALVVIGIALNAMTTMFAVEETSPVSRLVITQRKRYAWTLVGQLVAATAVLWPMAQYGVDDTLRVLGAWWEVPVFGWGIVLGYWLGIVSPALTLLTAVSIYRHPAQAAKQVKGGYILTEHARRGLAHPPVVRPVVAPGSAGTLERRWFDVCPTEQQEETSD